MILQKLPKASDEKLLEELVRAAQSIEKNTKIHAPKYPELHWKKMSGSLWWIAKITEEMRRRCT